MASSIRAANSPRILSGKIFFSNTFSLTDLAIKISFPLVTGLYCFNLSA